jgi:hypothetical protein
MRHPLLRLSCWIAAFYSMSTTTASMVVKALAAVRVRGSGVASVNVDYQWTSPHIIPPGFAKVCDDNSWDVNQTWQRLNNGRNWLCSTSNDAYIYQNAADGHWWIDEPEGKGVFIAPIERQETGNVPPLTGWKPLSDHYLPLPKIEIFTGHEDDPKNVS